MSVIVLESVLSHVAEWGIVARAVCSFVEYHHMGINIILFFDPNAMIQCVADL